MWQVGIVLASEARLVECVYKVAHIHLTVFGEDNPVQSVVRGVTGLHGPFIGEVLALGLEYLRCGEFHLHPMRVVCPCLTVAAVECQRTGHTYIGKVLGNVHVSCVTETCGILIMVVIPCYSLHVGVYLRLVADDLNVTNLAVTLLAMHNKKAVLEHRACVYLERRVMRQVCGTVIYMQVHIV